MYTLRRILEDGIEYNFLLGNNYTLILKERVTEKEWAEVSRNYWGSTYDSIVESSKNSDITPIVAEVECFGFIRSEDGTEHFLLPWQENYIVMDNGKTFFAFYKWPNSEIKKIKSV